jgi:hypothetical protein
MIRSSTDAPCTRFACTLATLRFSYETDKKDAGVLRPPTALLLPSVTPRKFGISVKGAAYTDLTLLLVAREEAKRESAIA